MPWYSPSSSMDIMKSLSFGNAPGVDMENPWTKWNYDNLLRHGYIVDNKGTVTMTPAGEEFYHDLISQEWRDTCTRAQLLIAEQEKELAELRHREAQRQHKESQRTQISSWWLVLVTLLATVVSTVVAVLVQFWCS